MNGEPKRRVALPSEDRREYFPDEVAVAVCIYGEDLVPAELTALLGVEPTHAHKRGDRSNLKGPPFGKGAWIREVRRFEPIDANAMLEELFAPLSDDETVWQSIASRFQVCVDLSLHTDVGCPLKLSPKTVHAIASRHAEIRFDVYAYGDNDA